MSEFVLRNQQFPHAIATDSHVGDEVTITIVGIIRAIEDDLIDISQLGHPPQSQFVPGSRTTKIIVTSAEATHA